MKLPSFHDFEPILALKRRMGVPLDQYGNLRPVQSEPPHISLMPAVADEETEALADAGLDITSLEEIRTLRDGTLAYGNNRVILYIRDMARFEPRFHIAGCSTLGEMRAKNRFERYVISNRTDGVFRVFNGGAEEFRRLRVCQNCLSHLSYDGFDSDWPRQRKRSAVDQFSLDMFFRRYPRSLHNSVPEYDSDAAPPNVYNPNWKEVSTRKREEARWRCQEPSCGLVLSGQNKRLLDVHHINGCRWDDRDENLKVLCAACHAKQPNHEHMNSDPRVAAARRLKNRPA